MVEFWQKLKIPLFLLLITYAIGTVGFYILGSVYDVPGWSPLHALYYVAITVSTVGYTEVIGDEIARKPPVMLFTVIIIMLGIGAIMYAVTSLTAFLVEGNLARMLRRRKMDQRIKDMKDHYIVCGGGLTGRMVIDELVKTGHSAIVVDQDEELVELISDKENVSYIIGDATDDNILEKAKIKEAKGLFAVLSSDKDNLYLTVTAYHLNPEMKIVARAREQAVAPKLLRSGATDVISPETIGGLRMASAMIRPAVVTFLDKMLRAGKGTAIRFDEVDITKGSSLVGKTIGEVRIRDKTGLNVIAVTKDDDQVIIYNPGADFLIEEGMTLVVVSDEKQKEKLIKLVKG